jgi:hypothetical protein
MGGNKGWLLMAQTLTGYRQGKGFLKDPYLCSLLFITFINDIVNEINAEIKLFADDTSLYLIVDNPNDTAFLLNQAEIITPKCL